MKLFSAGKAEKCCRKKRTRARFCGSRVGEGGEDVNQALRPKIAVCYALAAAPAGLVAGGCDGILNRVAQLLHLTFFPRAVSGTTRMLRHFRLGHIMRIVFAGLLIIHTSV